MAEKDIAEKLLEEHNDVFADIVNVVYFKKDFVKPEELSDAPTEFHYWTQDKKGCRELRRDVAKVLSKNGHPVAILCIENQTCIDETMPFRTQEYDSATYLMQVKNEKTIPIPVITIVLYFGKRSWNKPIVISEAIGKVHDIPEEILSGIQYYKMNLVEIAFLSKDIRKNFKSDFGIAADFFAETREKAANYIPSKQKIVHTEDFLYFMEVFSEDSRFGTFIEEMACNKKGAVSMCELFDLYENKGKTEGRVSMLLCYMYNGKTDDADLALLGATPEEIAKARELYNQSKQESKNQS